MKMRLWASLLTCLICCNASWGLIILSPADVAKLGREIETSYGRTYHYVTDQMGMGYAVDLYEINVNQSLAVPATQANYQGLYIIGGHGNLSLGDGNVRQVENGSFVALGTHDGYQITSSDQLLKVLSVKRVVVAGEHPISGIVTQTSLNETKGGKLDVDWGNGKSRRFLLRKDGLSFSMMDTWVNPGSRSWLEYKNHLESCFCIGGHGRIVDSGGVVHDITPGTIYILDKHDSHFLEGGEGLNLVSIFSPAIVGDERHILSPDGSSAYRSPSDECGPAFAQVGTATKIQPKK